MAKLSVLEGRKNPYEGRGGPFGRQGLTYYPEEEDFCMDVMLLVLSCLINIIITHPSEPVV